MEFAIQQDIIFKNPCKNVKVPKGAITSKRRVLTHEEIKKIIENKYSTFGFYPFMMLYLGLRRSEMLCLKFENINLKNKLITIDRVVNFENNKPVIYSNLKNYSAERMVPIPEALLVELNSFQNKKGYIFEIDGELLTRSQLRKLWDEYQLAADLKITQHMIRHTFATNLFMQELAQKRLNFFWDIRI